MADAPATGSMGSAFTSKLGPLPVWGWVGAGVVGVYVGRMVTSRRKGSGTASANNTPPAPTAVPPAQYGAGGVYGSVSPDGTLAINSGASSASPAGGYTDNTSWRIAAVQQLVSHGFGAFTSDQALAGYLDGRQPTSTEQPLIDYALSTVGLPPNPPTIVPQSVPDAPTTTPGVSSNDPQLYAGDHLAAVVRQGYLDVLGREPDAAGLQYWRGELATGAVTVQQFRDDLQASPEFNTLKG